MTGRATLRRAALGIVGIGGLLMAVELAARLGAVDPTHVPPTTAILATTLTLLGEPDFLRHLADTMAAWALGLAAALAVAVPLGLVLGASRRVDTAVMAVVELLRPIPSVALIPLVVLVFGRGLDMRTTVVAYAAAWPILLATRAGVRAIDPTAIATARTLGLGRWPILRSVALPSAAPFVAGGLRISAGIALILAISAELIAGGSSGLGVWMLGATQPGAPRELLYAGIVVAGIVGVIVNAGLGAWERRAFAWYHAPRGSR